MVQEQKKSPIRMKPRYLDRQGKPMGVRAWAGLLEDMDYKRVRETTLPDGKWVSTVWLGLNHNWGDGPPLIFETMVFNKGSSSDLDCTRYSTEAQAIKGHEEMVRKFTPKTNGRRIYLVE